MGALRTLRHLVPRPLRLVPADLAVVAGLVAATWVVVLLPWVRETPLRFAVGLAFALFAPGYALVAALFPRAGDPESAPEHSHGYGRTIDGYERAALSVGLSVVIVPMIGLLLDASPTSIRLLPVLVATTGFTVVAGAIATWRRWQVPPENRFRLPYWLRFDALRSKRFGLDLQRTDLSTVLLAASLLVAGTTVAYTVAAPPRGEQFTEFYLLTPADEGNGAGELVADDYPSDLVRGESRQLVVGVTNDEREGTNYTVVVRLQRVQGANDSTRVVEQARLHRFDVTLDAGEEWRREHAVTPTMTGRNLRLQYLLYRGELPANPEASGAYRHLHVWVNVTAEGDRVTNDTSTPLE